MEAALRHRNGLFSDKLSSTSSNFDVGNYFLEMPAEEENHMISLYKSTSYLKRQQNHIKNKHLLGICNESLNSSQSDIDNSGCRR